MNRNRDQLIKNEDELRQTLVTAGPVLQIHFSNIMLRIFRRSTLLMVAISLTTACMSAQRQMTQLKGIDIVDAGQCSVKKHKTIYS